jgi:hypothetical protein
VGGSIYECIRDVNDGKKKSSVEGGGFVVQGNLFWKKFGFGWRANPRGNVPVA